MAIDSLVQQVEAVYKRLASLYENANDSPHLAMIPIAFKELGVVTEELQVAAEEISQQQAAFLSARTSLETAQYSYQKLFELSPDACLITTLSGTIRQLNQAAINLLEVQPSFLIGKPITAFVSLEHRNDFRHQLGLLSRTKQIQAWPMKLCLRSKEELDVITSVALVPNFVEDQPAIYWQIRHYHYRALKPATQPKTALNESFSRYTFTQGETIPIRSNSLWQVRKGMVKLITFSERGEEILMGLAGPTMPFGATLTSLPTYQAIALSDVQLVEIDFADLDNSAALQEVLVSQVQKRLQQTEALLAIAGQRHVSDRLCALLLLLKQEVGEPVADGTRLNVYLRHEDLASACCTTRVTITRLLGKFQRQGQIKIDEQRHIILRPSAFDTAFAKAR